MAIFVSPGHKAFVCAALAPVYSAGVIMLYDGVMPASTRDAPTGTLVAFITRNGAAYSFGSGANGISFEVAPGNYIREVAGQTLKLVAIADGTARYARLVTKDDTLADSVTLLRIQMPVNSDDGICFNMTNPVLTNGELRPYTSFFYTIPPLTD